MDNAEHHTGKVKRMILQAAVVFLIVMILLTFFSKTINHYLLPEVECKNPMSGYLTYEVKAAGEVNASSTRKIIASGEWLVKSISVEEGERVAQGAVLCEVDTAASELALRNTELELLKLKNSRRNYVETYTGIDLTTYEEDVLRAEAVLEEEKADLKIVLALFDSDVQQTLGDALKKKDAVVQAYADAEALFRRKVEEAAEKKDAYERGVKEKELAVHVQKLQIGMFQETEAFMTGDAYNAQLQSLRLELMKLENDLKNYKDAFEDIDTTPYEEAAQKAFLEALDAIRGFEKLSESYAETSEMKLRLNDANRKVEAAMNDYADKRKNLERKNAEAVAEKNAFNRTVGERDREIALKSLELENRRSLIPPDGTIVAPVDCTIRHISIEIGQTTISQQALFEYIAGHSKMAITWMLNPAQAEMLGEGDAVTFTIRGQTYPVWKGKVERKEFSSREGMYLYTSEIPQDGESLLEGMGIEVRATRSDGQYPLVVPKSALAKQDNRDCIFLLKQRRGALGEEYYVEAVPVSVTETDDLNAAISGDIKPEDKVVTLSTKALANGVQVKLR